VRRFAVLPAGRGRGPRMRSADHYSLPNGWNISLWSMFGYQGREMGIMTLMVVMEKEGRNRVAPGMCPGAGHAVAAGPVKPPAPPRPGRTARPGRNRPRPASARR